jgi:hypothetical protein
MSNNLIYKQETMYFKKCLPAKILLVVPYYPFWLKHLVAKIRHLVTFEDHPKHVRYIVGPMV